MYDGCLLSCISTIIDTSYDGDCGYWRHRYISYRFRGSGCETSLGISVMRHGGIKNDDCIIYLTFIVIGSMATGTIMTVIDVYS